MENDKIVLILASVASMIEQFNMPNISLLLERGYKVHVACNFIDGNTCSEEKIIELKKRLEELKVTYYQIDFERNALNIKKIRSAYLQVLYLMKKTNYEFVHCHSPVGGVCGRLAGRVTKTKVIYTAHGFHFYKGAPLKNWIIYYPIERLLSKYTDILITINKEDYNRAKRFKAKQVEYIQGVGIELNKFNVIEIDRKLKRKETNLPEDAFVMLSVGELNKNKNHEVIIRALAKVCNPQIHYVICGQGRLKNYLKKLSVTLGVQKQVHLMGFMQNITEIYKISDFFVFPSFREGLSVALMEAMANGLPVICSSIRGNIDLIEDGQGGFLAKPISIEEFSENILNMVSDDKLRRRLGLFNLNKIKQYSTDVVLLDMENIYFK